MLLARAPMYFIITRIILKFVVYHNSLTISESECCRGTWDSTIFKVRRKLSKIVIFVSFDVHITRSDSPKLINIPTHTYATHLKAWHVYSDYVEAVVQY